MFVLDVDQLLCGIGGVNSKIKRKEKRAMKRNESKLLAGYKMIQRNLTK